MTPVDIALCVSLALLVVGAVLLIRWTEGDGT
jgi:hypothetical protein